MGKKSRLKQIKRIASQLPLVETGKKINVRQLITGADVLKAGTKKVKGKDVDPNEKYIGSGEKKLYVNHTRKLKKIFKSKGFNGVKEYISKATEVK